MKRRHSAISASIFAILTLTFCFFSFISCKNDDDNSSSSSEFAGKLIVFYQPNGLGDNSYIDNLCYGAHRAALEHNLMIFDFCPTDWEEAKSDIKEYVLPTAESASEPVLFIFADSGYIPLLSELVTSVSKKSSFVVFESKEEESSPDFVSTVFLPLYGASYLAGVAAKTLLESSDLPSGNETPRVLSVLANDSTQQILDAQCGFATGYGVEWDGTVWDFSFAINTDRTEEYLEAFHQQNFAAIKLSSGTDYEEDPYGFDSAWSTYAYATLFQNSGASYASPYDLYFPVCGGSVHGLLRYNREKGAKSFYTVGMDSDLSVYSSQVPFSVVKHIDRAVQTCVSDWRKNGSLPHYQEFGLESGYTELVISNGYESLLSAVVQAARDAAIEEEQKHEAAK